MHTSVGLLSQFFSFFNRLPVRIALVALFAFAFAATGLQAYPITLTITGTFGSPQTSGTDPLALAGTGFMVTTSIDTAAGSGSYPLGPTSITIDPLGAPKPITLAGTGGTAVVSVSGGGTTVALNNVTDAVGTFSATATVPSSVVGANPAPFPPTPFSNGSATYTVPSGSTTLSATGTVGGTTTATNISASPSSLSFSAQAGAGNPPNQTFQVQNATPVPYSATVTPGAPWLSIAGGATGTTPGNVTIALNTTGLSAGTYNGSIKVTSTGAPNTLTVPVTLTVTAPAPTFIVSPTALTFNYQSGGVLPGTQFVSVNSSGAPISFTDTPSTTSGGAWLSTNAPSGLTPGSIGVSVSPSSLTPGTYSGTVTFTPTGAANGPQVVSVTLNVTAAAPTFTAAPSSLTFNYQAGNPTLPPSQPVSLTSSGTPVNFTNSVSTFTGGSWLSVSPPSGTTPTTANVSVAPGSLSPGTYTGTVTFTPTGSSNGPQAVGVTLIVSAAPTFTAAPSNLTFNYQSGGTLPGGQSVALTSSGTPISFTDSVSTVSGGSWLAVSPGGGTTPASATVSVAPTSLPPGTYIGTVTFTPTGASNGPQTVTVTLNVTAATPTFTASPSALSFTYTAGSSTFPPGQNVSLTSSGTPINFTDVASTTSGGSWLSVTPAGGTTPATSTVSAAPGSLAPGTYNGSVTFTPTGAANGPQTVAVTLTVTAAPTISLSTNTATFSYQIGAAAPAPQSVSVTTSTPGLTFGATSDMPWLSVTPASGTTPGSLAISLNTASLTTPGTFTGHITVTAAGTSNSPQIITVTANVTSAPNIQASPSALSFAFQLGGAQPATQTLNITSSGTPLNFTATGNSSWLVVTGGGTTPGTVNVDINTSGLTAQTYTGAITIAAPGSGNGSVIVPVTLTVSNLPTLSANPSVLSFTSASGGSAPAAQNVAVTTTSGAIAYTVAAATTSGGTWLTVAPTSGTTPGSFSASVAPGSLAVGTYSGSISITAGGTSNSPLVIPVTYTVTSAPTLTANPSSLTFNSQQGGSAPATQSLNISGTAGLNYTSAASTSTGGGWLALINPTGTTPGTVTVSVTPGSLAAGTYTGTITTSAPGAATIPTPVTLNVSASPVLNVAPNLVSFTYAAGSSTIPPGQVVSVTSSGTPLSFTASASTTSGGSWLSVNPTSGSTPASVTISVAPSSLAAGSYAGTVTFTPTGGGSPQTVSVSLTVTAATPTLSVAPGSLSFNYQAGSPTIPGNQSLTVASSGAPISFTALAATTSGGSWLAVSPTSGATPGTLTVSVMPSALAAGTYNGSITVTPSGAANGPVTIPVTLTVAGVATFNISPGSLSFSYQAGSGQIPTSQGISLVSGGVPVSYTASAATSSGGNWLSVSPASGITPGTLTVSVAPSSLPAGSYTGSINITPSGGLPPVSIPVTLTVTASPTLSASPNPISFTYQAGSGSLPAGQSVAISSSGTPVNFSAVVTTFSGGNWLAIFPTSGTTPGSVLLTAVPGSLAPGTYTASLSITSGGASNSPLVVPVSLTITSVPVLSASPAALTFNSTTGGASPGPQTVSVSSSGGPLTFTASGSGASWLTVVGGGPTPGSVTVSVNSTGLAAGVYNSTVTLTTSTGSVSIPVTLNVVSSAALAPSPASLTFNYQLSGAAPAPQTISVGSTGSPLPFAVSLTNLPWLSVTPISGTTGATTLTATVNPAGLTTGTYAGQITLTTGSSTPSIIPVSLIVSSAAASPISASVSPVIFNYLVGSTVPGPKTVTLTSAVPVAFTVTGSAASWLTVTPASGITPGSLTVTAMPGSLAPGSYAASITVDSGSASPLIIPVFLSITAAPTMTVTPTSLAFAFQSGGTAPASQTVTVASNGIAFTSTAKVVGQWLSVSPASSNSPGMFTVTANPAGLLPGVYNGSVTFTAPAGNSPVNVPVVLAVSAGPGVAASPSSLSFSFQSGGANPATQTIALGSSAGPIAFTVELRVGTYTTTSSSWLTIVSPAGNTAPGTLTVTANPAGLVTGSYTGTINLTPSGAGGPITIPVEFDVNSTAAPHLAAVTNALSYATGAVAPGEIVSLWGTGLGPAAPAGLMLTPSGVVSSNIGNVRVLFDGIPAVLTMASDKQVNAIVPYALAGNTSTVVQVEYQGVKSNALTVPITASAPGLATLNASGKGEGAILNQDTSLNSTTNPAAVGSVIVLFGTGAGQMNPVGIDGIIPGAVPFMPVLPVSVTIGGQNAPVLYAGDAPSLVSGVLQINVQVPSGLTPGPQPVVLTVESCLPPRACPQTGTASSQADYTVVIK